MEKSNMAELESITWEALTNFTILGTLLVIIMQLVGKSVVVWFTQFLVWLFRTINPLYEVVAEEWEKARTVGVNLFAFGIALIITSLLVSGDFSKGQAFVTSVLATFFATAEYEIGKNLISLSGYKWK